MLSTLKTDLLLNDMIQFADSRLALISTKGSTTLLILLIDLYCLPYLMTIKIFK